MRKDEKGILAGRVECAGAWKHEWPDSLSAALSARRVQETRLNETGGSQVVEELFFFFFFVIFKTLGSLLWSRETKLRFEIRNGVLRFPY